MIDDFLARNQNPDPDSNINSFNCITEVRNCPCSVLTDRKSNISIQKMKARGWDQLLDLSIKISKEVKG